MIYSLIERYLSCLILYAPWFLPFFSHFHHLTSSTRCFTFPDSTCLNPHILLQLHLSENFYLISLSLNPAFGFKLSQTGSSMRVTESVLLVSTSLKFPIYFKWGFIDRINQLNNNLPDFFSASFAVASGAKVFCFGDSGKCTIPFCIYCHFILKTFLIIVDISLVCVRYLWFKVSFLSPLCGKLYIAAWCLNQHQFQGDLTL